MTISEIRIAQFRNLHAIELHTSAQFNVFIGNNGSGKTSLLEAIYYLSCGKSFRTHIANRIIQYDYDSFTIFAQVNGEYKKIPIGIQKSYNGAHESHVNFEKVASISTLAKLLPVQLIGTESYRYFLDGPKSRRRFLDWGLFHVEQAFYPLWQQLQHILQQRKAGLKNAISSNELAVWDHHLSIVAEQIDTLREKYVAVLQPLLQSILFKLLPGYELSLRYCRGWPVEQSIQNALKQSIDRDRMLGYTQYGPQKADLQLYFGKVPVDDALSQGQLKLAAYALHLAQGILLFENSSKHPIFLIDDLPSELDPIKRELVASILKNLQSQVFITGITSKDLLNIIQLPNTSVFHVEHGSIHPYSAVLH